MFQKLAASLWLTYTQDITNNMSNKNQTISPRHVFSNNSCPSARVVSCWALFWATFLGCILAAFFQDVWRWDEVWHKIALSYLVLSCLILSGHHICSYLISLSLFWQLISDMLCASLLCWWCQRWCKQYHRRVAQKSAQQETTLALGQELYEAAGEGWYCLIFVAHVLFDILCVC